MLLLLLLYRYSQVQNHGSLQSTRWFYAYIRANRLKFKLCIRIDESRRIIILHYIYQYTIEPKNRLEFRNNMFSKTAAGSVPLFPLKLFILFNFTYYSPEFYTVSYFYVGYYHQLVPLLVLKRNGIVLSKAHCISILFRGTKWPSGLNRCLKIYPQLFNNS